MELFLNLVWLLIAAESFVWWRQRFMGDGQEPRLLRRNHVRALALLCALAIYFPVISVSDDLHAEIAVIEDSSALRRSLSSATNGHARANHCHLAVLPAVLPSFVFAFDPGCTGGKLLAAESSLQSGTLCRAASGRAPPSV
jgi:hypothetical protein